MQEKTPSSHKLCAFRCLEFDTSAEVSYSAQIIILVRNYLFLKNNVTSEGAVSHNVLYYQQLSVARYQVSFFMLKIILSNYQ